MVPGVTLYCSKAVTPCSAISMSLMKKLPVAAFGSLVRISQAASATISGLRHLAMSTLGIICSAAVAMAVRGQRLFTPMP